MDFFAFASQNARSEFPITERFWIHFVKVTVQAYEYWDEDYGTIEEARERADAAIEDREVDTAHLTARISRDVDEFYAREELA